MTAYVTIINGQIVQDKPVTTTLIAALRDNPLAIAEGDSSAPRIKPVIFHILDRKTNNTNGQSLTAATWNTRDLQTVLTNDITGASLAANQITAPAGIYDFDAYAAALAGVGRHKLKLYNVTDAADILLGLNIIASASTNSIVSTVRGRFIIAGTKVLELRHYCELASTGGSAMNIGLTELYADVLITKVG